MNPRASAPETERLDEAKRFAAQELSRHERLVVLLRHADGLSFEEIAEVLELSEATVTRLYRKVTTALQGRLA